MKPSEVYTRAAELIASGDCSDLITAITKASGKYGHIQTLVFYFICDTFGFGSFTPENQRARELALYLMAEIAKDFE